MLRDRGSFMAVWSGSVNEGSMHVVIHNPSGNLSWDRTFDAGSAGNQVEQLVGGKGTWSVTLDFVGFTGQPRWTLMGS